MKMNRERKYVDREWFQPVLRHFFPHIAVFYFIVMYLVQDGDGKISLALSQQIWVMQDPRWTKHLCRRNEENRYSIT